MKREGTLYHEAAICGVDRAREWHDEWATSTSFQAIIEKLADYYYYTRQEADGRIERERDVPPSACVNVQTLSPPVSAVDERFRSPTSLTCG